MSFRYANFSKRETRWKIAMETIGMIVFITWVLWFTERLAQDRWSTFTSCRSSPRH